MGVDRPEEDDLPSADDTGRGAAGRAGRVAVEERDRFEYYDALREEVNEVAAEAWTAATDRFRESWDEHCERWPQESRKPPDRSADPPGSWRGDSGRYLDNAANSEVDQRCDRIADVERTVVSPAMRQIESCDSDRHLAGFDHRLKGPDRLKEKVAAQLDAQADITCSDAISAVKDTLRFTLRYQNDHYFDGVNADTGRMLACGFEPVERRNTWDSDLYKGINSRWREPDTGLMFEVQFHTENSYEAKQITHIAYERLRDLNTTRQEKHELEKLQSSVILCVSIPRGALEIEDY